MARILFLTQVLPYPLDSGAKIRAYYVLQQLAQHHQVTLVSFVRPDDQPESVTHLETFCRAVYPVPMRRSRLRDMRAVMMAGLTGRSAIIVRDEIGKMYTLLKELVQAEAFAVIHSDQTSMAQYALYAKAQSINGGGGTKPKILLDAHNALYRIPQRLSTHEKNPLKRSLLKREARALARYEAHLWEKFDHVVFVAEQDRLALQSQIPASTFHHSTIPICVNPETQPMIQRVPQLCTITHLGTMFWPPNVEGVLWFAQEVFPTVLEQVPGARFVIIGKNPPPEIHELGSQFSNIEVTGYVADPAPYLAETAVFIVPVRAAGGMRVKIPDAWCWGMPIVSTTIGAEGIDLENGNQALIADTPETMARAVVRILQNPDFGESLRQNGRRWVEAQYNWRQVYPRWNEIYDNLISVQTASTIPQP